MKSTRLRTSATGRGLALLLVATLLVSGSSGCALFRTPVPGFETVAIKAKVERDKKQHLEGDLEAYTTLKGTLVGIATGVPTFAITGGGGGFAVGALACAPSLILYPFCVLIATGLGFIGGAVFGLFGGGILGGIGGLPSETAEQITLVLSQMEEKGRFEDALSAAMRDAIPEQNRPKSDRTRRRDRTDPGFRSG